MLITITILLALTMLSVSLALYWVVKDIIHVIYYYKYYMNKDVDGMKAADKFKEISWNYFLFFTILGIVCYCIRDYLIYSQM